MNPIITGLLGVLVGSIIGHRFALGRDKRKEYNERAEKIRRCLLIEKSTLEGDGSSSSKVSDDDMLDLKVILGSSKAANLSKVHSEYKLAWENAGDYNDDGCYEFEIEAKNRLVNQITLYLNLVRLK
ncbi:hypothetical protein [Vibrio splendidus]|uniref:hypothetical protein n=1 Tax=Vibrio splendidus TaxID=29497 RepID=UPI0007F98056|nr:hypothetical protein [Vibrio splendidus]OBT28916.1 hypothetical protein A9262_14200 [Vibrio splendidus]